MSQKITNLLNKIKTFIQPNTVQVDFFLLIGTIFLSLLFTLSPTLLGLSYGNLDPSFNYGVNRAEIEGKSFGTEYISTYGPLGYIFANYLPENLLKVSIFNLIYSVLLGLGVYLLVRFYQRGLKRRILYIIGVLYVMSMTVGVFINEWNLLALFIIYALVYQKMNRNIYRKLLYISLFIVAGIFSFIKFTLGFGALATVLILAATHDLKSIKKRTYILQILVGLACYAITIVIAANILQIDSVTEYFKTAVIITSEFSAAMAQFDPQTLPATIFIGASLLTLFAWPMLREPIHKKALYLMLLPGLYLIWKYAVARQDGHLLYALQFTIPLAAIILTTLSRIRPRDYLVVASICVGSSFAVIANKLPFYDYPSLSSTILSPISNIRNKDFVNFFKLDSQKIIQAANTEVYLRDAQLPESMKKIIINNTVDIYPWETAIIEANNLRWANRPSPYSFETYSPYFDNLNADFIKSDRSPNYIIWHHTGDNGITGVDFRNVVWDEPKFMRELLGRYSYLESNEKFILLKKKDSPTPKQSKNEPETIRLGSDGWFRISSTGYDLQYISFKDVADNLSDNLSTMLIRQEPYFIQIKRSNGNLETYRFVTKNSEHGFLIDEVPKDWESLNQLLRDEELSSVTQFRVVNKKHENIINEVQLSKLY